MVRARLRQRETGRTQDIRFETFIHLQEEDWRRLVADSWQTGVHSSQELRRLYFSIATRLPLGQVTGEIELVALWLDEDPIDLEGPPDV